MKPWNEESKQRYIKQTKAMISDFQEFLAETTGSEIEKMKILSIGALELLDKLAVTSSQSEIDIIREKFRIISTQIRKSLDAPSLTEKEDTGEYGMGGDWWKNKT